MEHNDILEKINKTLSMLQVDDFEVLDSKSREIQEQIIRAEIPQDLERGILDAYSRLCDKYGKEVKVSVRSSAFQEDGEFGFAGLYTTCLNVPSDLILHRYNDVIASLFTPRCNILLQDKGLK